jgi:hypothetical protein
MTYVEIETFTIMLAATSKIPNFDEFQSKLVFLFCWCMLLSSLSTLLNMDLT